MWKPSRLWPIAALWLLSLPAVVQAAQPLSPASGEPNTNAAPAPRSVPGRGSAVSVKDFARCDGVGDDYDGLPLAANAAAGGLLKFPDEPTVACQTSRPILLASGTTVRDRKSVV